MQTWQITLAAGGTTLVTAENYNADPATGLVFVDQFGNALKTFAPGSYGNVTVVDASSPAVFAQPGVTVTDGDQPNT